MHSCDLHSQLTNSILQAAQVAPRLPSDLALKLGHLKARADQEPPRDPEDELAQQIEMLFGPLALEYARQIIAGQPPQTKEQEDKLLILLVLALLGASAASVVQRAAALGVPVGIEAINRAASQWAQSYSFELVRGINETTRRAIGDAVSAYARMPGMTEQDVARMLEPVFGQARARSIAATEITRAYSHAAQVTQTELERQGIQTAQQWVTWRDDRVCPLCAPMHNTFDWRATYPYGPPAHVSCRCWLALVRVPNG